MALRPRRTPAPADSTVPSGALVSPAAGASVGVPAGGVVLPPARTAVRTRRRPMRIFGAIALVLLAGLLAWYVVGQMRTQYTVVEVRTNIARGQQIKAADLTTVTIGATPGVSTVPGSQLSSLVGQHATIDLAAGSLLAQGAIGNSSLPGAGDSIIGLKLDPAKVMTGSIAPGSKLRLVVIDQTQSATTSSSSAPATGTVYKATLVSLSTGAVDSTQILANVEVSATDAPALAVLSAAGRLAVIKDSDQ